MTRSHAYFGTRSLVRTAGVLLAAGLLATMAGCGGGSPTGGSSAVLQAISVSPAGASVASGLTQQFTASATYSDGTNKDVTSSANWTTSDSTIATITSAGLLTALKQGSVTVSASLQSVAGSTSLTVAAAAVASIVVTPSTASIAAGLTQQFKATGTYTDTTSQDITNVAAWTISDTTIATISPTGLASTAKAGAVTVSATLQGKTGSASLTVSGAATSFLVTETDGTSPITGGGANVLLDGKSVGVLDSTGSLSVPTTPGAHTVTILDSGARGDLNVTAAAGAATPAVVVVYETDADYIASTPQIPQITSGVFNYTDPSQNPIAVTLLDSSGKTISISQVDSTYLTTAQGTPIDLSAYTSVAQNGTLSINLMSALATLGSDGTTVASYSPFLLEYGVEDVNGLPYSGATSFELGVYSVAGSSTAPPSSPSLTLGGMHLTFKKHSSSVTFSVTTGTDGSFSIAGVPPGQYDVSGSVTASGMTYNVIGTSLINSSVSVAVVPLAPTDVANNVPSVVTTATAASRLSRKSTAKNRRPSRSNGFPRPQDQLTGVPGISPYGSSITVSAADEDAPIVASGTYSIPMATQNVSIIYQVCSAEYPYYVQSQSQYNDLWSIIAVDASGNQILSDSHNVNEQLTSSPVWQGNGCTAVLQPLVDVSADTATAATQITLKISATNIGDSALATSVTAIVAQPGNFSIQSFSLDAYTVILGGSCSAVSTDTSNIEICGLANNGDYISIPSPAKSNVFSRPATAILQYPSTSPVTVTNVELDLVGLSGNKLDTIFNQAPGGIVKQSAPNTLQFSITYQSPSVAGSGPMGSMPQRVSYLVTVTGTQGGSSVTAAQNLTIFNTLWSAVDAGVTVPRYGGVPRDLGGDDWATQNTINWLQTNANLVTRFDDISGEHGRNIGHHSHGKGTDVDIFQFTSLNSSSGISNYNALRAAAEKAASDSSSLATVASWVTNNRAGIDALNQNGNVVSTRSGVGKKTSVLAAGWLKTAMLTGKLPLNGGTSVDLGLDANGGSAAWTPAKPVAFDIEHNSHVHVALGF